MKITVLTLFPEFFEGPLTTSVLARAIEAGVLTVECLQIRDFATNRHRTVDDTPYGGGAGMVMRPTELEAATLAAKEALPNAPVVLMSPQGEVFHQRVAEHMAGFDELILVCGRYEGIDERYIDAYVDAELSLGDFILTGGEAAAFVVIDAIGRLLPGALGNRASAEDESFSDAALEYPQFTRPAAFGAHEVPPVLLSGDHGRVDKWRRKASLLRTARRRPDLFDGEPTNKADRKILGDESLEVPEWLIRQRKVSDLS